VVRGAMQTAHAKFDFWIKYVLTGLYYLFKDSPARRHQYLCCKKSVVYMLECQVCNEKYIGSTIRALHIRIKEHLKTSRSAVFEHLAACHNSGNVSVSILAVDQDPKNLRIKEAILIKDKKPGINQKEEESIALSIIQTVI
jgi:hypothetical protein